MTLERIYDLAWSQAIMLWGEEFDRLMKNPDDIVARAREEKYWNEAEEIKNLIMKEREEK